MKRTFQVMGTSRRKACVWLREWRSPGPPRRPVGLESGAWDLPTWRSLMALVVKNLPANAGDIRDVGLIPGLGRLSGGEHSNLLDILAWRIPWTEEPGW